MLREMEGAVFATAEERITLPTIALVVACGDSDHGPKGLYPEIRRFLRKTPYELEEGQYFPLLRDGGPAALAYRDELEVDYLSLEGSMQRICKLKPQIAEALLFHHGPCGYYADAVPRQGNCDLMREKADLSKVVEVAAAILPGKKIKAFFGFSKNGVVDFHRIH